MSKVSTWMPLYVSDYLGDTAHLTLEEHGAYIMLLMHSWKLGPLPNEDKRLAGLCRISVKHWREISPAVLAFFKVEDGKLIQKRIEIERRRAEELSEKRRQAALQRGNKPTSNDPPEGSNSPPNDEQEPSNSSANEHAIAAQMPPHARVALPSHPPSEEPRKKERELRSLGDFDPDFDRWWAAYPRKVDKGTARTAYGKARRKATAEQLLHGLHRAKWNADQRFIPHPTTWLNGERWLDEVDSFDPVLRAAGLGPEDFDLSEFTPIGPPT